MLNIILPGDEPMRGYFKYYYDLDKRYLSRYQIKSIVLRNSSCLYSFYEASDKAYFRVDDELIIHFNHFFALTNYSFSTFKGYSHPTAWKVYGYVNNKARRLIDTKSGELDFNNNVYNESTFRTDSYGSFNNYVFKFLNNTNGYYDSYAVLHSVELFGIVYNQIRETCLKTRKTLDMNFLIAFAISV